MYTIFLRRKNDQGYMAVYSTIKVNSWAYAEFIAEYVRRTSNEPIRASIRGCGRYKRL